jgi:murein DD-endopeptidase MepM/ murein hydrolase activator NlpD
VALCLVAVPASAGERAPAVAGGRAHTVAPGDTFGAIARRYGVAVEALVAANRLRDAAAVLRIGRVLTIPSGADRGPTRARGIPLNLVLAIPDWVEQAPRFVWPVEGPVSSTFGRRRSGWHRGIDIKAPQGTPIVAAAPGRVTASRREPRYGLVVKIAHGQGFVTVYAHNHENLVRVGARVAAGEPIASVGRTGHATTHHLHFEVRLTGRAFNPLYLLPLPPRIAQIEDDEATEGGDD